MRAISVRGKDCLVDDEDYEYLNQWIWELDGNGHVSRWIERLAVKMCDLIVDQDFGNVMHLDGNRLNNQRANLKLRKGGVRIAASGRWVVTLNGRYIGTCATLKEAIHAQNEA